MRFLLYIVSISMCFSGCAEYFGEHYNIASINIKLPSNNTKDVAESTAQVIQLVDTVTQRYDFTLVVMHSANEGNLYVIPGYTSGPWPGQPDVDWNGGTKWRRVFNTPRNFPDKMSCTVFPPKSGDIAVILVGVDYASKFPPATKAFLADLMTDITKQFGRDSIEQYKDFSR